MRTLAIALLLLLSPLSAFAAITHDATTNSGVQTDDTTFAFNVTSAVGASKGVACVAERNNSADSVTAFTHNGDPLTFIRAASTSVYVIRQYYIDNPDSGTNSLSITWGGLVDAHFITFTTLNGTAAGAPEASTSTTGTGTSASVSLTTATNNAWIMDCVNRDFNSVGDTLATSSGQTQRSNSTAAANQILTGTASEEIPTAGAQTVSWALNDSAAWVILASSIASADAGGAVTTPPPPPLISEEI